MPFIFFWFNIRSNILRCRATKLYLMSIFFNVYIGSVKFSN